MASRDRVGLVFFLIYHLCKCKSALTELHPYLRAALTDQGWYPTELLQRDSSRSNCLGGLVQGETGLFNEWGILGASQRLVS